MGHKVVYAVPGVPYEMQEMLERAVLPDLQVRAGTTATIVSRTLRTWGLAESTLAEKLGPRLEALDRMEHDPTIAFLASGIEGIKVRITAKGPDEAAARALLTAEEDELRALLGDLVFGVDDESMEDAVAALLTAHGLTLGLAESLTGGLVGARLTNVAGASGFFKGSIVSYDSEVKFDLLGVPAGPSSARRRCSRWPRPPASCSAPTSAWRSPAWPAPPSRTASPSAPSSWLPASTGIHSA